MIVVTAASGKLGRAVVAALEKRVPAARVRLGARTPGRIEDLRGKGFEVARADYVDPASLREAFAEAEAVLVISGEGVNDDRFRQHKAAIDAAKAAGVGRIVYTSATNPTRESRFEWAGAHEDTEAYLKASGVPYTILRDNSYASNNDSLYTQAKQTGTLAFPGAGAKVAYVTHEDVAAAAAGALTSPGHENQTYEITGPEALDAYELAATLSQVTGRPIKAVDVPLQAFTDTFRSAGLPEYVVTGLTSFYAAMGAGEYAAVSNDVERLSGRPATPVREYLKAFA